MLLHDNNDDNDDLAITIARLFLETDELKIRYDIKALSSEDMCLGNNTAIVCQNISMTLGIFIQFTNFLIRIPSIFCS